MVEALKLQEQPKSSWEGLIRGNKEEGKGGAYSEHPTGQFQTLFLSFQLYFTPNSLGNPLVVFLDEPSMEMDPAGQQQIFGGSY